ncbi:MAG TPA: Hsp20/alpha crystallin family protein [Chloroflexi bacterium]|nr:Hsp20/alpha crystallin family protein [Chloroflexota bacterium]
MLLRPTASFTSPWREMERLRREMNRLFATAPAGRVATYPALNIWANEDGALVTAELPGVDPEAIDISVVGDTLTLKGSREPEAADEEQTYHRRERGYGSFSRSLQLPFSVEANEVDATFEKGILQINLPRAEADKPKKITVKAA